MKCVIIAAGKGSRLANMGDSKPLVELGGIPLIERVIFSVMEAGVTDFYIITGYNGDKIRDKLTAFEKKHPIRIQYIDNPQWKKQNGISVHCAHSHVNESFFLLMSDHIFEPGIIEDFKAHGVAHGNVILAVDKRIQDNPLVDIDDVTKVETRDGKIQNIGKSIAQYNAFDTGIFLCTPALFPALEESFAAGDTSLSGGIKTLAAKGKALVFDIGNKNWIDVDDEAAYKKAEKVFV